MRTHLTILISTTVFVCVPAFAQENADESKLIEKIELLSGRVERDKTLPDHPVVKVSIRGSKRFTAKYLHLLKEFKHLKEIDFGDLVFTGDDVKELWQPQVLANLLMDANENQLKGILPKLDQFAKVGLPIWNAELDQEPFSSESPSDPNCERIAKRQANAAIVLLKMIQSEKVWPLLKHSPDPRVRSYLIHRFAPFCIKANILIQRLNQEADITIRRALVLSLGEYDEQGLPEAARDQLLPKLQKMYETDSDPGLHSAVEWLLRKWKHEDWLKQTNQEWSKEEAWKQRLKVVEQTLAKQKDEAPQWYINSQSQTMVVIPGPVEFVMGSPETERERRGNERQHRRRIGRSFAMASTAVTLHQYRQFEKDHGKDFNAEWVHQGDLPAVAISWYMGAKYCNWLSEQEKLEPCYDIKGDEITLKENYLSLSGYRFPTEAEMECATRAGAVTSRHFGETDELLPNYAWYQKNKLQLVGILKPNDFGLLDTQGNVWVWCQERYLNFTEGNDCMDDKEDAVSIVKTGDSRVVRGGSFVDDTSSVRSANRNNPQPMARVYGSGFRLARTLPLFPLIPDGKRN